MAVKVKIIRDKEKISRAAREKKLINYRKTIKISRFSSAIIETKRQQNICWQCQEKVTTKLQVDIQLNYHAKVGVLAYKYQDNLIIKTLTKKIIKGYR